MWTEADEDEDEDEEGTDEEDAEDADAFDDAVTEMGNIASPSPWPRPSILLCALCSAIVTFSHSTAVPSSSSPSSSSATAGTSGCDVCDIK